MSFAEQQLQELRGDLHDLYDGITGLGIELVALNQSVRALTAHLTGEDPLRDSLYFGSEAGPAEEAPEPPSPPTWVNEGLQGNRLGGEQDAGIRVGAYIVISTFIGTLVIAALVMYALR